MFRMRLLKIFFVFSISDHRLTAMEFSSDNLEHVSQLKQMGIRIQPLPDGRMYQKLIFNF